MAETLLDVRGLKTQFRRPDGVVRAVDGLSFGLARGEAVAIVGESGSGKSVSVRSILGLLPKNGQVTEGEAWFEGRNLMGLTERELLKIRGHHIGMIFQDPMSALNPTLTLRKQLTEHLIWHSICGKSEARERAIQALRDVGIPAPEQRLNQYPFQLSGGMRQRVMIAMAILTGPKLLIADEPTTAVDVTVQLQILELLSEMKARTGMSIILITHDLGVARYFCDRVVVMYAGRAVEQAPMSEFVARPRHPYSTGLMDSTLELGESRERLDPIAGSPPDLARRPSGCPFHPRCPLAEERCSQEEQSLLPVAATWEVACWKVHEGGAVRAAASGESQ